MIGEIEDPEKGITHDFTAANVKRFGAEGGVHSVDWTFIDPAKLGRTAKATFEAMVRFRLKNRDISALEAQSLLAKWPSIALSVDRFARASTLNEKKSWFSVNMPAALRWMPWNDMSLSLAEGK